jgi:hypothetical protein
MCACMPPAHQRQARTAPCLCPVHASVHLPARCLLTVMPLLCVCPLGACSYDISTIASVIPAFASRQDLLVVDDGVSYPIQQVRPYTYCAAQHFDLYSVVCV